MIKIQCSWRFMFTNDYYLSLNTNLFRGGNRFFCVCKSGLNLYLIYSFLIFRYGLVMSVTKLMFFWSWSLTFFTALAWTVLDISSGYSLDIYCHNIKVSTPLHDSKYEMPVTQLLSGMTRLGNNIVSSRLSTFCKDCQRLPNVVKKYVKIFW